MNRLKWIGIVAGILSLVTCKSKLETEKKKVAAETAVDMALASPQESSTAGQGRPAPPPDSALTGDSLAAYVSDSVTVANPIIYPDPAIITIPLAVLLADPRADSLIDPLRAEIFRKCWTLRALSSKHAYPLERLPDPNGNDHDSEYSDSRNAAREAAKVTIKAAWLAVQDTTFNLIQAYKKELLSGIAHPHLRPIMLGKARVTDSLSLAKRPKIEPSTFLQENPFFFMGAGPFLERYRDENDTAAVFRGLQGKPELRYWTELNSNTTRVMRMIRSIANAPARTLDGEPIGNGHHEYDCPLEKSVKGIGSMTHILSRDFPVYFITRKGLLIARLVQVTDKLFETFQGCVSDLPRVFFFSVPSRFYWMCSTIRSW